jgi:glucosamine-6-phosphate deaminase
VKLVIVKDYNEASEVAFQHMVSVVKNNSHAVLGLATGSTPIGLYQRMVADHVLNRTSYKNVKTFNLDEYFGLSPEHEQSYYYFMNKHLFRGLDIDEENTHVPCGVGDIQKNCDDYNKMLEENPIDIQLLGLGGNGHIGFNEPFTPFNSVTHYVELEQRTREDNARLFFNGNLDEVPTHAITMGISNIMAAKKVLLIACGENKADAVKALVEGEPTEEIPASVIKNHPNCVVIIDEAAASKLEK